MNVYDPIVGSPEIYNSLEEAKQAVLDEIEEYKEVYDEDELEEGELGDYEPAKPVWSEFTEGTLVCYLTESNDECYHTWEITEKEQNETNIRNG